MKKRPLEPVAEEPESKRRRDWRKVESEDKPGTFYYVDAETGEFRYTTPATFKEKAVWEEIESTTNRGTFYYHNRETGQPNTVATTVEFLIANVIELIFKVKNCLVLASKSKRCRRTSHRKTTWCDSDEATAEGN